MKSSLRQHCHLFLLTSKYLPQHPVLRHPQLFCSLHVRNPSLTPTQKRGKIWFHIYIYINLSKNLKRTDISFSSFMQFWFVSVLPNYFKFATISKHLFHIFTLTSPCCQSSCLHIHLYWQPRQLLCVSVQCSYFCTISRHQQATATDLLYSVSVPRVFLQLSYSKSQSQTKLNDNKESPFIRLLLWVRNLCAYAKRNIDLI